MQDLSFKVILMGKPPQAPKDSYIDLDMPGMKLGPNRVQLKSIGNNIYEDRGVIVRRAGGRRTWRATVTVPDVGQTAFIFDVIY
jgi:hypothetical protein